MYASYIADTIEFNILSLTVTLSHAMKGNSCE